jgi:hypothetical protein
MWLMHAGALRGAEISANIEFRPIQTACDDFVK